MSTISWPICVLGPSRSGTSLTTRILNVLGVDLGEAGTLVGPLEGNNPTGFWEHREIMELNEEILLAFDPGARTVWRRPPPLPPGWQRDPRLVGHRRSARLILRRNFAGKPLWGWKDPRSCLTLPFWQELVPDLRYVICVRDPRDVAASLGARDGIPDQEGVRLWLRYMSDAVLYSNGARRLFVSFESYFPSWGIQVERLARFLGKPSPSKRQFASIADHLDEKLWHHRGAVVTGGWGETSPEADDLFARLCAVCADEVEADAESRLEALAHQVAEHLAEAQS